MPRTIINTGQHPHHIETSTDRVRTTSDNTRHNVQLQQNQIPDGQFLEEPGWKSYEHEERLLQGTFADAQSRERIAQVKSDQPSRVTVSISSASIRPLAYLVRNLTSAIITLCVGREQRLFAAHEDVLCHSPFFQAACRGQFFESACKRIDLPDEEPEVFSCVLEYLYKGDYYPRLEFDKRRQSWHLEDAANGQNMAEAVIFHNAVGGPILKDTVIYVCKSCVVTANAWSLLTVYFTVYRGEVRA